MILTAGGGWITKRTGRYGRQGDEEKEKGSGGGAGGGGGERCHDDGKGHERWCRL